MINKYIKNINEDKIEGELIKQKAQEEIAEKREIQNKSKEKNLFLHRERLQETQKREEILK